MTVTVYAAKFVKDPDAVLDYQADWSDWLGNDDTILSSSWASSDEELIIDSSSSDSTTATVWLSGGIDGTYYDVTNHIVTTAGREDDRTILIKVMNR